jgi:hypothetical protein
MYQWENAIERQQQLISPEDASDVKLIRKFILPAQRSLHSRMLTSSPHMFCQPVSTYNREDDSIVLCHRPTTR